jgi:WD40 repeat protein
MELPVWNLENGQVKRLALRHREGLLTAAFSDDGKWIVTTSFDAFASLWEVDSGRELARFSGGFAGIRETAISPDKARVALTSNVMELSVWDPANEQPMVNFPIEAGETRFAVWDPNGDCLTTWSWKQLLIWRAPSWEEIVATEAKEKTEIKQP